MNNMRRRESSHLHQQHSMTSSSNYDAPLPTTYQRHASVATSSPSFHENNQWTRDQCASSNNSSFYSSCNGNSASSYDSSSYKSKKSDSSVSLWQFVPCLMLMLVPWIPTQQTRWNVGARKLSVQTMIKEQKDYVRQLDQATKQIRTWRQDVELLTKENELSFREQRGAGGGSKIDLENEEYLKVEQAEEALVQRIDGLEKHIQKDSQKLVEERFGSGPHRVKVTVKDENESLSHFVIQLAMLMEMPHAVHRFLQMVDLKLWDELALVHGTGSDVIMATPVTMDHAHAWAGQRFVDANLTHMAFTEFSSTYPPPDHHKYSVAFSGRPGGPDFYISLEEEIEFHEHESTFGMVVEGKDVLDRFFLQRDRHLNNPGRKHLPHPDRKGNRAHMLTIDSIRLMGGV